MAYVEACFSQMDIESLNTLSKVIAGTEFRGEVCARISEVIRKRLAVLEVENIVKGPLPTSPWRETLSTIVQDLAQPEEVDWMEDDDDQRYVQHALDDIVSLYKTLVPIHPFDFPQ